MNRVFSQRIKLACWCLPVLALVLLLGFRYDFRLFLQKSQPVAATATFDINSCVTTTTQDPNKIYTSVESSTTQPNPVKTSTVFKPKNVDFAAESSGSWNASVKPTTVTEFYRYLRSVEPRVCEVSNEIGGKFLRLHNFVGKDGQKKICLDNGVAPDLHSCLVYSFGINNEWSFDDSMAEYGCKVFAFDPTMKQEDHQRSPKISFFKTGLGTSDSEKDEHGWKIRQFSTLKRELGHENRTVDVLKLDIEGAEWAVLEQLVATGALKDVKQLAVEVHLFSPLSSSISDRIARYWNVFRKIELEGFVKFSAEQNPFLRLKIGNLPKKDSPMYEVAWFNKKYLP